MGLSTSIFLFFFLQLWGYLWRYDFEASDYISGIKKKIVLLAIAKYKFKKNISKLCHVFRSLFPPPKKLNHRVIRTDSKLMKIKNAMIIFLALLPA